MRYVEPTIATVLTNPTNRDLKYTWAGKVGTAVKAGGTVILPYDVYTAANTSQRANLDQALKSKMVKMKYITRAPIQIEQVDSISTSVVRIDGAQTPAAPAAANARPIPKDEPAIDETKPKREKVIEPVADNKDVLKDGEDLVQKYTGQKTTTMRDAMGWKAPETSDTRKEQEVKNITMNDAMTENIGDPIAKAAALAEKEAKAKAQAAKLAKATKAEPAVDPKKSAAAKKAAETRRKKAAAKKTDESN